ncbi:IclR family transcriptional regulator [Roseibium salinum]|uniref:IclR family transcriptional regulator n=1 Tax=Roseibium salinum TaxID=1604349 RepID=UPI003618952A
MSYRRGIYCLGPRIEELGRVEQETNPLSEVVRPIIASASHDLSEAVMASRLTRGGPICMAVARSNRPISVEIKVGTIFLLHCSAQGKLWLASLSRPERDARLGIYRLTEMSSRTIVDRDAFEAELERIRDQGFALNRGENEPDIGAVAVPVMSEDNEIILTLSVFGLLSRFDERFIELAVQRLGRAAHEVRKRRL